MASRKKAGKAVRKRKAVRASKRSRRPARGKTSKRGWFSRFLKFAMLLFGIAVGLLIPWSLYLDHQVRTEFEGRKWDLPSRVYAQPLELYPGRRITAVMLEHELSVAGYRKVSSLARPGDYSFDGSNWRIYKRGFRFVHGAEPEQAIRLTLSAQQVLRLVDDRTGNDLDLIRLDPAEIASIYPLHKEDRTLVRLEDVPPLLVTGLQAVEDRKFKHHHGIDPRAIGRAILANLKAGKAVQGGSTITQQLVKNYFLSHERTLIRKLNEAIMAVLLEWHYDKSEILEAYINEVYLGQQGANAIHGFARASRFYFDQPLERLDEAQIALLIGLVKGASFYNPRRHPERARTRRNEVLDAFAETGLLSDEIARKAAGHALGVTRKPPGNGVRFSAFIDLVRRQLAREFDEDDLKTEGLRIFTTLSPSEQELAQEAVSSGLSELGRSGLSTSLEGALVVAEVSSGEVRAVVGGRNPSAAGFNRAVHARRQVGSVIKPLVYLLALEHGGQFNLLTQIEDRAISLRQADGTHWSPSNYDERSHGVVTLLEALTQSYNQATVRLGLELGVTQLLHRIQRLGVNADIPAVPSVFLGAAELTPIEVAQMYQPLAAGGYAVPLRSVIEVEAPDGRELTRYPLRLVPQQDRAAIAVLNFALTQVVAEGTARELPRLINSSAVVAGKTGTTNDRRDSWFVGYTRNRLGVVWVGEDDNRPAGVTGSNAAMRLWAKLFRELPIEDIDLRLPDDAHWTWVDLASGALSAEQCDGAVVVPFVEGSEPTSHTECLARLSRKDEPFWRKWFGKKN